MSASNTQETRVLTIRKSLVGCDFSPSALTKGCECRYCFGSSSMNPSDWSAFVPDDGPYSDVLIDLVDGFAVSGVCHAKLGSAASRYFVAFLSQLHGAVNSEMSWLGFGHFPLFPMFIEKYSCLQSIISLFPTSKSWTASLSFLVNDAVCSFELFNLLLCNPLLCVTSKGFMPHETGDCCYMLSFIRSSSALKRCFACFSQPKLGGTIELVKVVVKTSRKICQLRWRAYQTRPD
jgi:hypothetical protein